MSRERFDFIFGMGAGCSCSRMLRERGLQYASFPLDWVGDPCLDAGADIRLVADLAAGGFREWFEKESEALAYLGTDKTAQNVIHVWPYSPDLAFEPGGTYVADVDEDIIDSPEIKITKKVTLKLDEMKKSAFADEASESDTEVASVTVLFTTSNRTSTIETNWKPEPGETQIKKIKKDNRFTFDSQTLLFRVFRGFRLLNWKDEAGSGTYANLASIQEYVTGQEEEEFTFIAQVESDPKESATLDKDKFRDFITKSKKALITGIAQVEDATAYLGEDERFDVTKLPAGAVKVDDGAEDSEYAIYAWFEGDEVRWCTDASVAFMAPDCTDMLKSTNFQTFSFAGFDLYKTTSLAYMFDNCNLLTGIDFGQNVVAPNLTSMAGMFQYAYNLQSVSFDAFDKVGSTLDMNHLFFNLDGVRDPNDPSVGVGQEMVKAHIRNKDNGGSALKTIDFGKLPTITSFTDVTNMFAGQNSVEHLDLSKFDAGAISSCYGMFIYCQSLSDSLPLERLLPVTVYRHLGRAALNQANAFRWCKLDCHRTRILPAAIRGRNLGHRA